MENLFSSTLESDLANHSTWYWRHASGNTADNFGEIKPQLNYSLKFVSDKYVEHMHAHRLAWNFQPSVCPGIWKYCMFQSGLDQLTGNFQVCTIDYLYCTELY